MSETSPEELKRIVDKWKAVLDYNGPNSKAMLIEPHSTWIDDRTPELKKAVIVEPE